MICKTKQHIDSAVKGVLLMLTKSGLVNKHPKLRDKLEIDEFEREVHQRTRGETDLLFSIEKMILADHTNYPTGNDPDSPIFPRQDSDSREDTMYYRPVKHSPSIEEQSSLPLLVLGKRKQFSSRVKISDFDVIKQEDTYYPEENDSSSRWGSVDDPRQKRLLRGKRGTYRKYNETVKKKAIELAERVQDPAKAARALGIPSKNLKRWLLSGPIRKKGGRKTQDPDMERRLMKWIEDYRNSFKKLPTTRDIKDNARRFSSCQLNFKASKGWLEKFLLRHGLAQKRQPHSITRTFLDTHTPLLESELFIKIEAKQEEEDDVPLSALHKCDKLANEFRLHEE